MLTAESDLRQRAIAVSPLRSATALQDASALDSSIHRFVVSEDEDDDEDDDDVDSLVAWTFGLIIYTF